MKQKIQSFGRFLSGMVMPNIGAFIAWGLLTALFIATGWLPNEKLSSMVSPMLTYVLPVLIAYQGGKMVGGPRGAVMGVIATVGVICGSEYTMLMGAMIMGPFAGWVIKQFDKAVEGKIKPGFEMLVNNFSVGIFGLILAIIGYYAIGPFMTAILNVLSAGVQFLVDHAILPLISVFCHQPRHFHAPRRGTGAGGRQVHLLYDRDQPRRRHRRAAGLLAVLEG